MLKVLRVTGDSVSLQWSAPYSDGGQEITRYVVLQKQVAGSGASAGTTSSLTEWDEVGKVSGSTMSFTVSRLRDSRHYHFAVYAMNRSGKGELIETARSVTPRKSTGKWSKC